MNPLKLLITPFRKMRFERAPEKEGEQDTGAVKAYDRTSDWLPFKVLRFLTIWDLNKLNPQGRLLDAGCGPGHLAIAISKRFPDIKVTGLDINRDMIAAAEKHNQQITYSNVTFDLGDIQSLPYEDEFFNCVVSSLSLHHWEDAGRGLSEIHRVLKPGGNLLLLDTRRDCHGWFFYGLTLFQRVAVPADIRRTNGAIGSIYSSYIPSELVHLLKTANFKNIVINMTPGWMVARGKKE